MLKIEFFKINLNKNLSKNFSFYLAFLSLFLALIYSFYKIFLSFDKVKEIYFYTGIFGLIFLNLSVIFSLFKSDLSKFFGNFSLFFGLLHFLNYFIFDNNANFLSFILDLKFMFKLSGFLGLILLLMIFLSFFKAFTFLKFMRSFGFLALIILSFHFYLSAKSPNLWEFFALFIAFFLSFFTIYKIFK